MPTGYDRPMGVENETTKTVRTDVISQTSALHSNLARPQVRRRPPLSVEARARSDLSNLPFNIETIREDVQQTSDGYFPAYPPLISSVDRQNIAHGTQTQDVPSRSSSRSLFGKPQTAPSSYGSCMSQSVSHAKTPSAKDSSEKRPSFPWRTISGGILFDRASISTNRSSLDPDAAPGHQPRDTSVALKPLQPPARPQLTERYSSEHQVRVETSFSQLQNAESPPKPLEDRRRTSMKPFLNPRDLFPSYIELVRRIRGTKSKAQKTTVPNTKRRAVIKGHRTGWRRDNIASALHRVSSLLSDIRPLRSREKSRDDQSPSTSSSKTIRKDPGSTKLSEQPVPVERVRSMEMVADSESESSSLLKLRMGSQPPNTPDEHATYRVKRSPSAETECFWKIDISIRGGTSYLPSEARRVHTPPLPKEGLDGRRRGFFFDHNTTQSLTDQSVGHASKVSVKDVRNNQVLHSPGDRATDEAPAGYWPLSDQTSHPIRWGQKKDWHGLQVAALDSLGDGSEPLLVRDRSRAATFLIEQVKKLEEEIDYTIPEHLPSSPLCPRHPRYWRIVKGRGSQFRGCWMHGIGL